MSGKCTDCKWFRTKVFPDDGETEEAESGICDNAAVIRQVRVTLYVSIYNHLPVIAQSVADEINAEAKRSLRFSGQFGCIHFQAREEGGGQ